jgi:hypothetical protein
MNVQQLVRQATSRLAQELLVQLLNRGIFVRFADGLVAVNLVQAANTLLNHFFTIARVGLSTAVDAATRAGQRLVLTYVGELPGALKAVFGQGSS